MQGENLKPGLDLSKPIPTEVPSVAGWKEVPLKENGELLVAIGPFSGNDYDRIFTSSIYFGEREDSPYSRDQLNGALITTFARQEAANQLLEVEEMLSEGMHLIVFDTFRTLDAQQALYDQFFSKLKTQRPNATDEELSNHTQKFVSIPSTNPDRPSPHNTGGAVDVAIYKLPEETEKRVHEINGRITEIADDVAQAEEVYRLEMERISLIAKNAEMLNFGTQWDWGGAEAALYYFEVEAAERTLTPQEEEARQNRRLLYNAMMKAGFEPYEDEWWHYNSKKSQMGAKTAGLPQAEYGAATLSEDNQRHEDLRRRHLKGTEMLSQSSLKGLDKIGRQIPWLEIAAEAAQAAGDMKKTTLPKAAVIEPPEEKAA